MSFKGDTVGIGPLVVRLAGEFRALVGANGLRISPEQGVIWLSMQNGALESPL